MGGKPPCFGPPVLTPEEANVWVYYGGAASVRFDLQGVVTNIAIFPENVGNNPGPFQHLPMCSGLRMGQFRDLLIERQIDFDEGEDNEPGGYYILAERRCTATGIPYERGKLVAEFKRVINVVSTVSGDDNLPDFVLRYWRHPSKPIQCI